MKYLFFILSLSFVGCGDIKRDLAPEVIVVENTLNNGLGELLEISIEEEACHLVEQEGFECNIPEQLDRIFFVWDHDSDNTITYKLHFCLKKDCPKEIVVQRIY